MKIMGLLILILLVAIVGGLFFLAQQSKHGAAPGISGGALSPCPSSPNCVSSEPGTPKSHAIQPLPLAAWGKLDKVIRQSGGVIIKRDDHYIAATFTSPLMGFVDDVEFRKAKDAVHIRSASRVGYGDMGANRKRVEKLRAALTQ